MTAPLLPCPFCGEQGTVDTVSIPFGADCADIDVRCIGCGIKGPSILVDIDHHTNDDIPALEAEAVAAWNSRIDMLAEIEALKADAARRVREEADKRSIALEAAEQRASAAEHRLFSYRRHRTANSMALADFIKTRAPHLWPDYSTLGVNYSYYDEAAEMWVTPSYHGDMSVLEHRAEKAEERVTALQDKLGAALRALYPFASWAENEVDAEGWKTPPMSERIVDWFGPSDFRNARTAYAELAGKA